MGRRFRRLSVWPKLLGNLAPQALTGSVTTAAHWLYYLGIVEPCA
jgi:hypothetical protein